MQAVLFGHFSLKVVFSLPYPLFSNVLCILIFTKEGTYKTRVYNKQCLIHYTRSF